MEYFHIFLIYNYDKILIMKQLVEKIKLFEKYYSDTKTPTYRDFLHYADITSKDLNTMFEILVLEDNNKLAEICYKALVHIKTKLDIKMEKIIYQFRGIKFNYNILYNYFTKYVNMGITIDLPGINRTLLESYVPNVGNEKNILQLPKNTSGVSIVKK